VFHPSLTFSTITKPYLYLSGKLLALPANITLAKKGLPSVYNAAYITRVSGMIKKFYNICAEKNSKLTIFIFFRFYSKGGKPGVLNNSP
jgi:hypothetical protein